MSDGTCLFTDEVQVNISNINGSILPTVADCHPENVSPWDMDKGKAKLAIDMNGSGIAPFTATYDNNKMQGFANGNYDLYVDSTGIRPIVIEDNVGCTQTINVNIPAHPDPIRPNATIQHAHCELESGSISMSPTGGNPAYDYNWGNSPYSGPVATNLPADDFYQVIITDQNNCEKDTLFTIEGPFQILEATVNTTTIYCAGEKSTAIITAQHGSPPYTYSKDGTNFQSENTFENLSGGDYTFMVKDRYDCQVNMPLTINEPTAITASASTTNTNCAGSSDGSITITASGGTGTLEYSMDGQIYDTNPTFDNLSAGVYSIYIKDANNCFTDLEVTVNDNSSISLNEILMDDLCRKTEGRYQSFAKWRSR